MMHWVLAEWWTVSKSWTELWSQLVTAKNILEKFSHSVTLRAGLSKAEIARFQAELPGPLPPEIAEVLACSAGFEVNLGRLLNSRNRVTGPTVVLFTGNGNVALPGVLACPIPLLGDGFGNFWVVDVSPNGAWGAVVFVCHDPPVFVIQARDFACFLDQVLDPEKSDPTYALNYVRNAATTEIWKNDPWLISVQDGRRAQDRVLSRFASQLPEGFCIADLRSLKVGSGFSWGKAGPNAEIRRIGTELLFGVEAKPPGYFAKFFSRHTSNS